MLRGQVRLQPGFDSVNREQSHIDHKSCQCACLQLALARIDDSYEIQTYQQGLSPCRRYQRARALSLGNVTAHMSCTVLTRV